MNRISGSFVLLAALVGFAEPVSVRAQEAEAMVYNDRGLELDEQGDYEKAIASFNEAVRLAPGIAVPYANRSASLRHQGGRLDAAMADANYAMQLDPNDAGNCNERGLVYLEKEDYDRAIADFNRAIQLAPNSAIYLGNRAEAWLEKHEYDRALADLNRSLQLDPNEQETYYDRGRAYGGKGDYDRAIADFDQALRINPKDAGAYAQRAWALGRRGDYDRAIADTDAALRLNPKYAFAYGTRSWVWRLKDQLDRSLADADEAIKLDPEYFDAYISRGKVFRRTGEYAKALADFNEALRLNPKSDVGYDALAWLQATCPEARFRDAQGAFVNANRAYEMSDGKDAWAFSTMAAAYAENGDFEHACEFEAKAVDLHKEGTDKQESRERLALYKQNKPYREAPVPAKAKTT